MNHLAGQEGISNGISDFYQKLYSNEEVEDIKHNFYDNCPKLSQNLSDLMGAELIQQELLDALMTSTDPVPGLDGLT